MADQITPEQITALASVPHRTTTRVIATSAKANNDWRCSCNRAAGLGTAEEVAEQRRAHIAQVREARRLHKASSPLSGEQLISLRATAWRWSRDRRHADARQLADAAAALIRERDQLAGQVEARDQAIEDARQIMNARAATIGRLADERDQLAEKIAELLKRTAGWEQSARDNGDFYQRTTDLNRGQTARVKASVYDALAHELRDVLGGGEGDA